MKRVVILGGTGTLGQEIAHQLLNQGAEVKIYSRDELKQKEMQRSFGFNPKLIFRLGDVRDEVSLRRVMYGADTVFHVAALKHVDSIEENPEESVKTNILGTIKVADSAETMGISHVIFSSTDKAVDPINVYGQSKAISERILLRRNDLQSFTKYSVYRWGNVVGSRGSVIPQFFAALKAGEQIKVTDKEMTRFWINIADAVGFMLSTYERCPRNQVCLPPIKAASLVRVIKSLAKIGGVENYKLDVVGLRLGEKLHEVLVSQHSGFSMESSTYDQYTDSELEALLIKALEAA